MNLREVERVAAAGEVRRDLGDVSKPVLAPDRLAVHGAGELRDRVRLVGRRQRAADKRISG